MSVGLEALEVRLSKQLRSETDSRDRTTTFTSTATTTKLSSQESLLFGMNENPESVTPLSSEIRQYISALELAVIFEDCVDTLTALSNAVAAPTLEMRTASSIVEDEFFNRPRYGGRFQILMKSTTPAQRMTKFADAVLKPLLPPIPASGMRLSSKHGHLKSQSNTAASLDSKISLNKELEWRLNSVKDVGQGQGQGHGSGSSGPPSSTPPQERREKKGTVTTTTTRSDLDAHTRSPEREKEVERKVEEEEDEEDEEKDPVWLLKQYYQPKVYKRVWQADKETAKRTLDEMIKSAGLKRAHPSHKLQADMGSIKMMMADIFNELVQKGTYESLETHLTHEREELNKLSKAAMRLKEKRKYSRKLKAEINETRQAKKNELQMFKLIEHQIEDEGQEIRVRTAVETVYTQSYVDAKIQQSLKSSAEGPDACEREIKRMNIWFEIEETAHWATKTYLVKRLNHISSLLDYWMEKYETDKERLMADLEELKEERAEKAEHRRNLEAKIRLWMPIIKDDRRLRKIEQEREDFFKYCSYLATRVAARWRGYMVRAGLGRFRALHQD